MAVAAGHDVRHELAAEVDRLVAVRVGPVRVSRAWVDDQRGEPDSRLAREERVAAHELALVEGDEALEPGFERRVVGGHVRTPEPVCLLETQRVERPVAEIDEPEIRAGLPEPVVEDALQLERVVELEAELPDVRETQAEDAHAADLDVARPEEGERLVRDVLPGQALEQLV